MKKKLGPVKALSLRARKPTRPQRSVPKSFGTASVTANGLSEERWKRDMVTLRRAAEDLARKRTTQQIERRLRADHFDRLAATVAESTDEQRAATIQQLFLLDPERTASFLNLVLQAGSHEERQQIGRALEQSGLVDEAVKDLTGGSHGHSYRAFSLLFLVAKAGAISPLLRVIEDHPNIELRLALIRLLGTSGAPDLVLQFRRLLANNSLPTELSLAIRETLIQLGDNPFKVTPSAA